MQKQSVRIQIISLLTMLGLLIQCELFTAKDPELPAQTQEGKNTLGCRFNGRAWVPDYKKPSQVDKYFNYYYDAEYANGTFNLKSFNFVKGGRLQIVMFNFNKPGTYPFVYDTTTAKVIGLFGVTGYEECFYNGDPFDKQTYCKGSITVTKFDQGIIAGYFAFTLAKAGCDTMRVTDGRFDLKLN